MQNLIYEWLIFQNSPKFEPKSENFEKSGDFAKNLAQFSLIGDNMNGSFSLKNWHMYGSTFTFPVPCSKTNLSTPWVIAPPFQASVTLQYFEGSLD